LQYIAQKQPHPAFSACGVGNNYFTKALARIQIFKNCV